jgi:hypothetical protein
MCASLYFLCCGWCYVHFSIFLKLQKFGTSVIGTKGVLGTLTGLIQGNTLATALGSVATVWLEEKVVVRGISQVGEYGYATLRILWMAAFYFTNWVMNRFCLTNSFETLSCGVCNKVVWFLFQADEARFFPLSKKIFLYESQKFTNMQYISHNV